MRDLSTTSNAIETEVLAQYRRCESDEELEQWLSRELTQLANADLAAASSAQQEAWLKRLFTNLRLLRLAQLGEAALTVQAQPALSVEKTAQIEVLEILETNGEWARLCVLGTGTYEMLLHQLRALALLGCTLTTSSTEYVARFCTAYERFSAPQAAVQAECNWPSLLLSLHQALKTSPLLKTVVAPAPRKSEWRERSSAKQIQYPPVFSSWRERLLSFACALGIVVIAFAIVLGSPAWMLVQIKQRNKISADRERAAVQPNPVIAAPTATPTPTPTPTPTELPTPAPVATPTVTPTPEATPPPVATPIPAIAATERTGFFVIGLAAREEANAQAEAQQRRQEGLNPIVVYSSNWSGLTPNYYQVVYGIFAQRADTTALRKELEKRGIKTYVMHSGQRVRP